MKTKHNLLVSGFCLVACVHAVGEPVIITQPEGRSVSLGVEVVFSVIAVSSLPISYQWRKDNNDLPDETSDILVFANSQVTDAGSYTVVASDASGSVTSLVATLTVDGAFSKIVVGDVVNDGGASVGAAWGDYDNDGWLDLFVGNAGVQSDFLYHNNGDGTFTRTSPDVVGNDRADSRRATWGDYDNDGNLDLFVTTTGNNLLYHNNGDGTFSRIANSIVANDGGTSSGTSWVDYDKDGNLDLYVSNFPGPKFLYRNNPADGGSTFTKVTESILVTESPGDSSGNTWGDYDNDGDLDAFICTPNGHNVLYRNEGGGTFTKITDGILVNEGGMSFGCAWGDYDNDGWLDLFVCNGGLATTANNFLYHNNGDGTFTKITSGIIVNESGSSVRCAWGDYDNDSFLDLFTADYSGNNQLYHNNGNGTFTKITIGSLVNDGGHSASCVWGDYDNDGFLDLFVANGFDTGNENNFLYRNSGNGNSWIKLQLFGGGSNRYGVGAKVKVNAVIGGMSRWLIRSIEGSDASGNASALIIGLGDATVVTTLRVEWPSGVIQELHELTVNQSMTVLEAVEAPPVFFTQPRSQTVLPGSNVTFRAMVASVWPLSYQWWRDEMIIPGATTNTLTLSNAQWVDSGTYSLTASNRLGVTSSESAVLTVAPVAITTQPKSQYARPGNPVTLTVSALSDSPLTYQWMFNGENLEGATGDTFTIANMQTTDQGNYAVMLGNSLGSVTSDTAVLTALLNPDFVQQPATQTVVAGDTVTFTVEVSGTPPFGYRWRRNNQPFVPFSQGMATLTISNVPLAYNGNRFDVVVTNLAHLSPGIPSTRAFLYVLADSDGDHVPDDWETAHGLDPNDSSDAALDKDGDGMTNLQEYLAGTDPLERLDYLRIEGITLLGGAEAVAIRFLAVSNRTYSIQYYDPGESGTWRRLADVATATSNRVVETTDRPLSSGDTRRIYRLVTPRSP